MHWRDHPTKTAVPVANSPTNYKLHTTPALRSSELHTYTTLPCRQALPLTPCLLANNWLTLVGSFLKLLKSGQGLQRSRLNNYPLIFFRFGVCPIFPGNADYIFF